MRRIRIAPEPFDPATEAAPLQHGQADVGATVSFVGFCRDEGGLLDGLEIEHYPGMAEAEIDRIAELAEARWPVLGICIVHRCGVVRPGEPIVLVATAARHRAAAFTASEFLMDYLKTDAPFGKRELRSRTTPASEIDGIWVDAKPDDDAARARWRGT